MIRMNAVRSALLGVLLYASMNTIVDVKLKQYTTAELLIGWYVIMLPFGAGLFIYQKFWGGGAHIPSGGDFVLVAITAIAFFIADFFYLGAYTKYGNDVVSVTMVAALMPVIGAAIKFGWVGETPTRYHFLAFACAALAITFIAIGNAKKPVKLAAAAQIEVPVGTR